ncbi:TPA: FtsX-like permease family protein [Enterococcus faecium]
MKSYLSLIPISAKVRKKQNRMTLLCIIFAVFLVTSIFSLADMGVRMETNRLMGKHGSAALQGISSNQTAQSLFLVAGILFVMILIAGVLMISSSINNNVIQKTKFFGMMRCIGMSKKQIIHFVRLEALNWCKTAIPIGIAIGIVTTWILSAFLKFMVAGEFSEMPLFGISVIGIVSGAVLGVVTVLIASSSPAKRASKVSPIAAVSGISESEEMIKRPVNTRTFRIDTALGVHHAMSNKKNLFLMMGSFALSIILFLSFSVLIDFVGYLMPQSSNTSDINISSSDGANSIEPGLLKEIRTMAGVKEVYGRKSLLDVSAEVEKREESIDLISYDKFDLDCLVKDKLLRKGSDISKVYGNSQSVLIVWDEDIPLKMGDFIQVGHTQLEISGMLKFNPFSDDGRTNGKITVITSAETFQRVTGVTDYALVMIQATKDMTDENVQAIDNILTDNYILQDKREQRTTATYMAFVTFVYGFIAIITLVTVLNIMNSISMSVSARMKQYGAMRAVGMDNRQISKMIASEAFTYAISGSIFGCIIGLLISKGLYDALITSHFSYANWSFPYSSLIVILIFVFGSAILAMRKPLTRIKNMSVAETINEL